MVEVVEVDERARVVRLVQNGRRVSVLARPDGAVQVVSWDNPALTPQEQREVIARAAAIMRDRDERAARAARKPKQKQLFG